MCRPIFVYGDAISALPGTFSLVTAVRFSDGQEAFFIDYSGAKYARSVPKIDLTWKSLFGWLKTAISSTACGTVTLKSPPSRGADAPHVHPRLQKHLSRCTLDCGFKTLESPALRGFEAGPRALATAALYLVLKSNGLPRPKIRLKKFGFSSKSVPANIAKKLPPQRCSKLLLIAFSASLTNGPCSLSRAKAGTHSASLKESHTAARTPKQGAFRTGALSLPSEHSARSRTSPGRVSERRTLPLLGLGQGRSRRTQKAFGTAMRSCASLFRGVAAPLGCVIFLQFGDVAVFSLCAQHFLNVQGWGGITTLGVLCVLLKRRTAACQKGAFAVF